MIYLAQTFKVPGASGGSQEVPIASGLPSQVTGRFDVTGVNSIQLIINFLIIGAATIAIVVIIWSGIQWITSGGDPGKVAAARSRLMYAVVGLLTVAFSFVIIQLVYTVLTGQGTPTP